MKAIKFDMEIPFWCSFGDFSSLNIKLTYPFPPLTTLFGMIQNAMGKPTLHNILDKKIKKKMRNQYINDFSHLKFAIIIKDFGEKIEDFVNIHKGNRNQEKAENKIYKQIIENFFKTDNEFIKRIKNEKNVLKTYDFYKFLIGIYDDEKFNNLYNLLYENGCQNLIEDILQFWNENNYNDYEFNKSWVSTQINRQKIVNPKFSIYISSDDLGEWSIQNIFNHLKIPKRPLYIGESDDVVTIVDMKIVNVEKNQSDDISSVLPDIYPNTSLTKIPTNLKYNLDDTSKVYTICSIPKGYLNHAVDCYCYNGENFVFL